MMIPVKSYVVAEASCNDGEEYLLKWEINGKNVDDLYEFCSYWPVTKVSPKTPEKLEYEIEGFKTLHDFIEELSKEFSLSRLGAVLPFHRLLSIPLQRGA
ncbi:hypothetical protein FLT15_10460 [Paenibacillus thiaminolyticus]|uniref:hypothetical protein n=1 Tax=Paenibacillus thiaminolyticus TaxID=49283 RepID=UPI001164B02C|nr:hypothetical protein [Paenibacillus thiaminolyticus]NGP58134.1 hypothetical protein [Paenibacillus thiaminolyticus]NGP58777.1 hypothetical protein [Paenibacillus thiaminolyticus]